MRFHLVRNFNTLSIDHFKMWRNFLKEIVYSAPLNGAHLNGAPLINGASLNTARGKRWTYSKRAPHNGCGCDFFLEPAKSYNIAKFCFPELRNVRRHLEKNGGAKKNRANFILELFEKKVTKISPHF